MAAFGNLPGTGSAAAASAGGAFAMSGASSINSAPAIAGVPGGATGGGALPETVDLVVGITMMGESVITVAERLIPFFR